MRGYKGLIYMTKRALSSPKSQQPSSGHGLTYLQTKRITLLVFKSFFSIIIACLLCTTARAEQPSGNTHYILEGNAVAPWLMVLGDESEWYQPFEGDFYRSKKKAITYEKVMEGERMVSVVKWLSKRKRATFSLSGKAIDISALENSAGIIMELKLHQAIQRPLIFRIDCDYPCTGSFDLRPLVEAYPVNEWFTLPIPLRCFVKAGADLSNVNSPMNFETRGKFTLSIGDVRLVKLPESFSLCRDPS